MRNLLKQISGDQLVKYLTKFENADELISELVYGKDKRKVKFNAGRTGKNKIK